MSGKKPNRLARELAEMVDAQRRLGIWRGDIPNAETQAAMRELEEGGGKTYATPAELFKDVKI